MFCFSCDVSQVNVLFSGIGDALEWNECGENSSVVP